jgi:hypothetical protein
MAALIDLAAARATRAPLARAEESVDRLAPSVCLLVIFACSAALWAVIAAIVWLAAGR